MKNFTPKALIFDVDGTLVHNMPVHNQIWLNFLAGLGIQIEANEFQHKTAGKTSPEVVRLMLGNHLTDAEARQYGEQKEILYRSTYQPQAVPGLHAFLAQAHQAGLPMAIASAGGPLNIGLVLDGLGIRPYFQAIVSGEDVQHGKPAPDLFLKAAERLGVDPADCLVFEDAWFGVEAAHRAGMRVILLTTTIDPQTVEEQHGVETAVPNFAALDFAKLSQ